MIHHPRFPDAVIFIAASVWGLYWVPLRALDGSGLTEGWSVALFNAMPLVVLLPLMLQRGAAARWRWAAFVGLFTGAGLGLYAVAIVETTVVRATLLFYLTPIWSTFVGAAWLGETVTGRRWAAIGVGLSGLVLLLSGGGEGGVPVNIGDFYGLLSGIVWAVGVAAIKRAPEVPLVPMALFQFLFASLTAAAIALAMSGPPAAAPDGEALAVAAVGAVGIILPSLLAIFWAVRRVFPGRVGLLMMSEVIVAVVSASVFLENERLGAVAWAGALMIIGACLLEVRADRAEERA